MADQELPLRDAVDEPVQTHVARFGQLGLDGLVGNVEGDLVVAMKERRRLRVPQIGEGLAFRDGGPGGAEGAGPLEMGALINVGSAGMPRW